MNTPNDIKGYLATAYKAAIKRKIEVVKQPDNKKGPAILRKIANPNK